VAAGDLADNVFVAWSFVPKGVSEKALGPEGDGYFTETLTYSVQATTEMDDGMIATQAAFIAGVESNGQDTFEERLAKRFDFKAIAGSMRNLACQYPKRLKSSSTVAC